MDRQLNFIDTHCHLTSGKYSTDIEEVLLRARDAGVSRILVVGSDLPSSNDALCLASKGLAPALYATAGVHPHDSKAISSGIPTQLAELARNKRVLAVGETGLDYYYDHSERDIQREVFRWHIELAEKVKKPLIIHIRDSFDDAIEILQKNLSGNCGGVIHSFSGDWKQACAVLDLGFYISFSGMLTFKRNDTLREVASRLPKDRILCETDGPFLSPEPKRGRRNEPSFVRYVYSVLGKCRKEKLEDLCKTIRENSSSLFKWGVN